MMSNNRFNTIKTPEEWKQSVLDYKNQNIDDLKLQQLKNKHATIKNATPRRKLHPVRVCILAAAITILACGCVLAYDIFSRNEYFAISRAFNSWFNNTTDEHIQTVNKSVTIDNLRLTLTRITTQKGALIFEIKAKTTDGSDFNNIGNRENLIQFHSRFCDVNVLIDGVADSSGSFGYSTFRIDDETNAKEATFEVYYRSDTSFAGKNISLQLNNLENQWLEPDDIGLTDKTLYDLFDGATFADNSTFEKYEPQGSNSSFDQTYYYIPPAGNMHIALSDKYSDCYIDNAGFGDCMTDGKQQACFYISITANSYEEYRSLRAIGAYNTLTGEGHASTILNKNGNSLGIQDSSETDNYRLIMVLVPARDDYWSLIENITDPMVIDRSFLQKYQLAVLGSKSIKDELAYKGTWTFDVKISEKIFE